MTARDPLFVTGPNGAGVTSPTEARLAMTGLVASGAGGTSIRQGVFHNVATAIVNGTTSMAYTVASFPAAVQRSASGGVYLVAQDGVVTVPTTSPPGSGSRYDLIWILVRDFEQGDTTSTPELGVTQGPAGGSPSKPYGQVPPGAMVLAEALVPAGVSTTASGVTITHVHPWTVARGAPIPVRSQAERDAIAGYKGLVVRRLDQGLDNIYTSDGWRIHGALTLRGQTEQLRVAAGTETGKTSESGNLVVQTGLSSLVICIATPASGGTWTGASLQRIGPYDGGNANYRWRTGDNKALSGVTVAIDYIAIGSD